MCLKSRHAQLQRIGERETFSNLLFNGKGRKMFMLQRKNDHISETVRDRVNRKCHDGTRPFRL